jgi:hypothetical protein
MTKVYKAIANVSAKLAKEGIGKDRSNQAQGYKFRGIDDVYNALAPILAAEGLCILPTVTERVVVERTNAKGTALFYVTVKVDFAFVCAEDGSSHTVTTYGEAMDSGDKATNKAMSAAYKYAAMQAFCIPTEGDNDADAQTHEVRSPEAISRWAREAADWTATIEGAESYEVAKVSYTKAIAAASEHDDLRAAENFKATLLARKDVPARAAS